MRPLLVILLASAFGLCSQLAVASEFTFQTSHVTIPENTSVTLKSDDALEVDSFDIDGQLILEGYSFRIDTTTLVIGNAGIIRGYSSANVLNTPPNLSSFSVPAASGPDAPNQMSNNTWYIGNKSAGTGSSGTNGADGDPGNPGDQQPGSLILIAESMKFDGRVALLGQTGTAGQSGQDGQTGGTGGRGMDAWCKSGNTSAACYSGTWASGPGGLGGFGGHGGPGGPGGAATPIVLITYSNMISNFENVSSQSGDGGNRGEPGRLGDTGTPGGPGRSCSAKAKFGSFFGACSTNGGAVTTEFLADNRERPTYVKGGKGVLGSTANWAQDPTAALLISQGVKPENGVLSTHIDLSEKVKMSRSLALRVELIGRLATTLIRIRDEYTSASADRVQPIERQFQVELLPVIARAASIVDLGQVVSLIEGDSSNPLDARIDATIPILRESFISERSGLLSTCNQIRDTIRRSLGDEGTGYFQRVLSWCSAAQLTWLPFIAGQQKVVFKTPQPVVGPQFQPYFTVYQEDRNKTSARMGSILFLADTGDHRGESQMVTDDLVEGLMQHSAPSGLYSFSIARSRELLDDVLALDRSASLIRSVTH